MAKKTIHTPQLHQWQSDFVDLFDEHKDEVSPMFVIKSVRQTGKSFLMGLLLVRQALEMNCVSFIVSPTLNQSRKMFKDIVKMFGEIPCVQSVNKTLLEIEFSNGSEIHFVSGEQGENLRGNTVTGLLVYDEGAYLNDDVYGITLPYVSVHKRPIIMVSTPAFNSGTFYNIYTSDNDGIYTFNVNEYDLSFFITEEQKQLFKKTMTKQKYMSEIEGEFISAYSEIFGDFSKVVNDDFDRTDLTYYMGIDWGAGGGDDYTSISIFNSHKQMCFLKYFNDLDANKTIDEIAKIIERFKPKRVVVESNSIGSVFYDLLRKKTKYTITKFTTTNDTKNQIINELQLAIQNEEITLLDDVQLKVQLMNYQIEPTKTGKVTYNAKKGQHDDLVMSTAIALHSMKMVNYSIR